MSRTYRRLRQRRGKHNQALPSYWWGDAAKLFRDGQATMQSTPSWWIREFMTVPQRAQVRALTQELHRLWDIEDAPEFPLAKKPHLYFW
jgi:hypothetical protein